MSPTGALHDDSGHVGSRQPEKASNRGRTKAPPPRLRGLSQLINALIAFGCTFATPLTFA